MTLQDKPIDDGLKIILRRLMPSIAWALGELPFRTSLDEMCVELDVITGTPAIDIRSIVLIEIVNDLQKVDPFAAILYLSGYSIRLSIWCVLSTLQMPARRNAMVEQLRDDLFAWCHGRSSNIDVDGYWYDLLWDNNGLTGMADNSFGFAMSSLYNAVRACMLPRSFDRNDVVKHIESALATQMPESDVWDEEYQRDLQSIKDRMNAAIINFPVSER